MYSKVINKLKTLKNLENEMTQSLVMSIFCSNQQVLQTQATDSRYGIPILYFMQQCFYSEFSALLLIHMYVHMTDDMHLVIVKNAFNFPQINVNSYRKVVHFRVFAEQAPLFSFFVSKLGRLETCLYLEPRSQNITKRIGHIIRPDILKVANYCHNMVPYWQVKYACTVQRDQQKRGIGQ